MNDLLWDKLKDYTFDKPNCEYSFSIRLAYENCWTENFVKGAIQEYKKFMYLAATYDEMVSPSEIADKVWHQHLIFSKSYQEFCSILGKQIQHIPSTHHKDEFKNFKEAKERTEKLYHENFGEMPKEYWKYSTMLESFQLKQSGFNVSRITKLVVAASVLLLFGLYFIFRETISGVENDQFYVIYFVIILLSLTILYRFNTLEKKEFVKAVWNQSLIKNLSRPEIIYLIFSDVSHAITLSVDELIGKQIIQINDDKTLSVKDFRENLKEEEIQLLLQIESFGKIHFSYLKACLLSKPFYKNPSQSIKLIKNHLLQSEIFIKIFSVNLIVCSVLIIPGILRLATGISHEKPVAYLCVFLLLMMTAAFFHLKNLSQKVIVNLFENKFTAGQKSSESEDLDFEFAYLAPLLMTTNIASANSSVFSDSVTDFGSSHDSSCGGSSCGSCGGCGGD